MSELNDRAYYLARAETSRLLAAKAIDPATGAIHLEFAERYEAASQEATYLDERYELAARSRRWR